MDEARARALLEQVAGTEAPPPRVDVGLARRQGRRRLRWRRACVPGASALAVVAVIALLASGILSFGPISGPGRLAMGRRGGSAAPGSAPRQFSPLIPYAAFGWLPPGYSLLMGDTFPDNDWLEAGPGLKSLESRRIDVLEVYSADSCSLTTAQVIRRLNERRGAELNCGSSVPYQVTATAPPVNGRLAFWAGGNLIWQYAPGGMAILSGPQGETSLAKIARGVRFGTGAMPAIEFPVQLTGRLSTWRFATGSSMNSAVAFMPYHGVLAAQTWSLRQGNDMASISVFPDTYPGVSCGAANSTVGGYRVNLGVHAGGQDICAADARGLHVDISIDGRGAPSVLGVFAHDVRLLGPDPANWTTRPLG